MNIFAVDEDPRVAARALCDRHVVRMTLETAQILCTVARALGKDAPYRATHARHPAVLWAGACHANWLWLVVHGLELAKEYERRYGRRHKSRDVIEWARDEAAGPRKSREKRHPFAQTMPEVFRGPDAVAAYRRFYCAEKARFAGWKAPGKVPRWFKPVAPSRATRRPNTAIPAAELRARSTERTPEARRRR